MKVTALEQLKKVSGRLRRIFHKRPDTLRAESRILRLLVVDDQASICFSMRDYFQLQGYHVDTARTIEEAEKLIKDNKYAAVIQDLRIGGTAELDGLQMIELIRNSHPTAGIVVLTAYGSPEVETRARHVGADAFLRKPTPLSQIAQVVQGVIESPKRSLIKH